MSQVFHTCLTQYSGEAVSGSASGQCPAMVGVYDEDCNHRLLRLNLTSTHNVYPCPVPFEKHAASEYW